MTTILTRIIFAVMMLAGLAALLFADLIAAHAHIHDRPDLNDWMNTLQSRNGSPCCSYIDDSTVPDPDWDTTVINGKNHYRVRIGGRWVVVTDEEVVDGPNKFEMLIVWVYYDAMHELNVRCFMPGAGG